MDNISLISIIAGILIVAIGAGVSSLVIWKKSGNNKKLVIEFLEGLESELFDTILKTIKSIDPKEFDSLEEFETAILSNLYSSGWNYVIENARKAFADSPIIDKLLSYLDQETVIKFIDKIVDKYNVNGTISNQYAAARLENSSNIVEEDNKLAEEYSNPELYNEESNNEELPPAEEVVHTEEEIAAINPQTDKESEEFDKVSMEIIDENKPSIIRTCDKNGNIIYYEVSADGKKKRVKREYAEAHM